eukprot:13726376-Alexandrium_andersonii.AAC.1
MEGRPVDQPEPHPAVEGLGSFMLYGPVRAEDVSHLQATHVQNLDEFEHVYTRQASKVDIAEICGGEGRSSTVAARRRMR